MKLTNWVKDHIDELDKDVEDLKQVKEVTNPSTADEEIEDKMETED